ncbi:hypothetical protein BDZ91DRAFT_461659 [Kalaharituber pfeilii]|nr:hypothetical protein BDZ91DRAFT_461659 [Kalaharituber pfeilii]
MSPLSQTTLGSYWQDFSCSRAQTIIFGLRGRRTSARQQPPQDERLEATPQPQRPPR